MSARDSNPPPDSGLRAYVKELVDERFDGNITHAAKAFGISHPYLSQFLNSRTGAGKKLLRALADYTRRPIDELMRLGDLEVGEPGPSSVVADVPVEWERLNVARMLQGWSTSLATARGMRSQLPRWAFQAAGLLGVEPLKLKKATPELAADLAQLVWQHMQPEAKREAQMEEENLARSERTRSVDVDALLGKLARLRGVSKEELAAELGGLSKLEQTKDDTSLEARTGCSIEEIRRDIRAAIDDGALQAFDSEATLSNAGPGPKVIVNRTEPFFGDEDPATLETYRLNREAAALMLERLKR